MSSMSTTSQGPSVKIATMTIKMFHIPLSPSQASLSEPHSTVAKVRVHCEKIEECEFFKLASARGRTGMDICGVRLRIEEGGYLAAQNA